MGMTIEEARIQLIMNKSYALGKDYEAIEVALETMRKYQKIERILQKKYDKGICEEGVNDWYGMVKSVREVLENGNVNV